ncbi:hypothetical protein SFUMM280S_00492 [Streptomyces fumanus]
MNGVGFSNGWALLALKYPPPLVPSSLIASCEATAPPFHCWLPPVNCPTSWMPEKFWITPRAASTIAATVASGTSTRVIPRTRSVQKLPSSPERSERANPRTRATATAMPTAAETKFCTARPAVCTTCPMVCSP